MRSVRSAIALILLMALSATLHAQGLIVHAKPVRLRHLSGMVVDPTGVTVAYTLIELRDATDHHVIASTFGDGNGKFSFEDRKRGTKLEIRISRAGFQSVQYGVVIGIVGREHIRVVLPVAV
jgi:Carboxypeptidase regulatory-like domain